MKHYLADQAVTVTVDLVDEAGAPYDATAVSYRVLNEAGTVIVNPTVVNPWVSGSPSVTVTVPSGSNALLVDTKRGLRVVEFTLTTAAGTRLLTDTYLIEAIEPLTVPDNTFQTLAAAELLATELPKLDGWSAAARADKVAALMQARIDISALPFRYTFADPMSHVEPEFGVDDLKLLSEAEWNALSDEFKTALYRAQVYQANDILGGDPYEARRRQGLMSETIAESSMMFRPGTPLKMPVCERAMRELSKYLVRRARVGRA